MTLSWRIFLVFKNDKLYNILAVEQAGEPALDGRHRALSVDTLAIDDLARAAGTQAVEE